MRIFAFISFALAGIAALTPPALSAAPTGGSKQYDVIPTSWITYDGDRDHAVNRAAKAESTAFVFPSLASGGLTDAMPTAIFPNFFKPDNPFDEKVFGWSEFPDSKQSIQLKILRAKNAARIDIDIDSQSMSQIRQLTWKEFRQLQKAFRHWLFKKSDCGFFVDCESSFGDGFRDSLISLWKNNALERATYERFSGAYLGASPITYSGNYDVIKQDHPIMYATRIERRQQITITWGGENLYPVPTGIGDGYARATSAGHTDLRIVQDHGMRLFPAVPCGMQSFGQDSPSTGLLLPYRKEWASLLDRLFIPIYNIFDLHNRQLLTISQTRPSKPTDCPDNTAKAPPYLFLLSPGSYIKADVGPGGTTLVNLKTKRALELRTLPGKVWGH